MSEITIPVKWLNLVNVHDFNKTCDTACVIHNQSNHHMRYWPLHWRVDRGIFERICPAHGTGHPDPDQFPYWKATHQDFQSVHGCCGCCHV